MKGYGEPWCVGEQELVRLPLPVQSYVGVRRLYLHRHRSYG